MVVYRSFRQPLFNELTIAHVSRCFPMQAVPNHIHIGWHKKLL
jgi:hypothetical protein